MSDASATADPTSRGEAAASGSPVHVPVNMYESDAAVVVVVPLPGVMPDNIDVVLSGRQLRISASMRSPAPKDYLLHEWHYGPFERTVELPEGYGGDATTSFGNGQLAVSIQHGTTADGERRIAVD
jgi:HSP20 family molecular chaperone IbpA